MRHWLPLVFGLAIFEGAMAQGLRDTLFAEADALLEGARNANAVLLAPRLFADGLEAYAAAEADMQRGRNLDRIRSRLAIAVSALACATDAAEISSSTGAAVI